MSFVQQKVFLLFSYLHLVLFQAKSMILYFRFTNKIQFNQVLCFVFRNRCILLQDFIQFYSSVPMFPCFFVCNQNLQIIFNIYVVWLTVQVQPTNTIPKQKSFCYFFFQINLIIHLEEYVKMHHERMNNSIKTGQESSELPRTSLRRRYEKFKYMYMYVYP